MGTLGKWAQLCSWMEGHEGSSMNHLSGVSLPQILMIYPRQESPAMRGGQMHIVCSRVHAYSVFICTCQCAATSQTYRQIHKNSIRLNAIFVSPPRQPPPRSLAAQLSPCLLITKTNCQQKADKQSYPSWGPFGGASWCKWVLSSYRGQGGGEVTCSREMGGKGW